MLQSGVRRLRWMEFKGWEQSCKTASRVAAGRWGRETLHWCSIPACMRGGAALAGTANSAQSYLGRNDHPLRVNLRVVSVRYQQRALSRREAGPGGCAAGGFAEEGLGDALEPGSCCPPASRRGWRLCSCPRSQVGGPGAFVPLFEKEHAVI